MKNLNLLLLILIFLPSVLSSCFGQLYSGDFVRRGLEFDYGKYAYAYEDGFITLDLEDIAFGSIQSGNLTVGVQGLNMASVVDLGTESDLILKYNIIVTLEGNVYSSIVYNSDNNTFSILKDISAPTFQILPVLLINQQQLVSFCPYSSHLYLINTTYEDNKNIEYKLIRMYVVSASESIVSLRWDVLFDSNENLNNINCGSQSLTDNNIITESAIYNYTPAVAEVPAWLYSVAIAAIAVAVVSFIGLIILTVVRPNPNYQRIQ